MMGYKYLLTHFVEDLVITESSNGIFTISEGVIISGKYDYYYYNK